MVHDKTIFNFYQGLSHVEIPCSLASITDISLEGCEDCGVTTASREQSMPGRKEILHCKKCTKWTFRPYVCMHIAYLGKPEQAPH